MRPESDRLLKEITGYRRVNDAAITPDGRLVAIHAIHDGPDDSRQSLRVVDLLTDRDAWPAKRVLNDQRNGMVALDPTGRVLAFSGKAGASPDSSFVEMKTGMILASLREVPASISAGGRYRAMNRVDGRGGHPHGRSELERWGAASPFLRFDIDGGSSFLSYTFSADDRRFAWGRSDGVVMICDLPEVNRRLDETGLGW